MFRGIENPILFLYPIDEFGEAVGDEIPIVGGFLDRAVEAVGGIAALGAAIAPMQYATSETYEPTRPRKRDRLAAIILFQHAKGGMPVLPTPNSKKRKRLPGDATSKTPGSA